MKRKVKSFFILCIKYFSLISLFHINSGTKTGLTDSQTKSWFEVVLKTCLFFALECKNFEISLLLLFIEGSQNVITVTG